jgi:hypothetical protein
MQVPEIIKSIEVVPVSVRKAARVSKRSQQLNDIKYMIVTLSILILAITHDNLTKPGVYRVT